MATFNVISFSLNFHIIKISYLFLLTRWNNNNSITIFLTIIPYCFNCNTIWLSFLSCTMLYIALPFTWINGTISLFKYPISIHIPMFELTLIIRPIFKFQYTFTMKCFLILIIFSLIWSIMFWAFLYSKYFVLRTLISDRSIIIIL
jgi:hypothetical protein